MFTGIDQYTTADEIINHLSRLTLNPVPIEREIRRFMRALRHENDRNWANLIRHNNQPFNITQTLTNTKINVIMDNIIERNVSALINLPANTSNHLSEWIKDETLKGRRSALMVEDIKSKAQNITKNSANLIGRTQVSITQSALTEARCEVLGVKCYRWRTSKDERVRASHSHMSGVIIFWDDPPSPESLIGKSGPNYHAGNYWNCRCYSEPIINPDRLIYPVKVYLNGQIQQMNKKDFLLLL